MVIIRNILTILTVLFTGAVFLVALSNNTTLALLSIIILLILMIITIEVGDKYEV
ncbi:MAG: hypothetical protein ACRCTZ_15130 [Sarcina sp.]